MVLFTPSDVETVNGIVNVWKYSQLFLNTLLAFIWSTNGIVNAIIKVLLFGMVAGNALFVLTKL